MKVLLISLLLNTGFAQEKIELKNWIVEEAQSLDEYLFSFEESELKFSSIHVRFRASYGVEIPFLASAKIRPEIELSFSK